MAHQAVSVPYRTQEEIEDLVSAFEAATLPNAEFNHAAHMTVALWYLTRLPFEAAVAAMRTGIRHFAAAHHHDHLYHETITLFWLKLLQRFREVDAPLALADLAAEANKTLGDTGLIFRHYSRELLFSAEARARWVEPDLRPMP